MICEYARQVEDMIVSPAQKKSDYEFVNRYWADLHPMAVGNFYVVDMEGQVDYSAARRFTEVRLKEIQDIEAEIKFFESWIECVATCVDGAGEICDRILARERAALVEIKRGMKL